MATWTKADLAARVLENLGVLGAGQSATDEDSTRVQEIAQSSYERLRAENLAPFDIATIPEWAQTALRDYVCADCVNLFGVAGERLQSVLSLSVRGKNELRRQVHNGKMLRNIKGAYF